MHTTTGGHDKLYTLISCNGEVPEVKRSDVSQGQETQLINVISKPLEDRISCLPSGRHILVCDANGQGVYYGTHLHVVTTSPSVYDVAYSVHANSVFTNEMMSSHLKNRLYRPICGHI